LAKRANAEDSKRVGVIGCGAIGTIIAEAFERRTLACDELILYDYELERAEKLKSQLHFPTRVVLSLDEMLRLKPKVVVEAASQQAARDYVGRIVAEGAEVIVMSTGALLGLNLVSRRVHVPSGAIGGLDALAAAALAGVDEVVLTTRKNPKALDVDYGEERVVYEGDAEEAARRFPREMNVAATLALTVKPTRVKVRVVSDPLVHRNTHEIHVKWRFGEMFLRFANDPHPENPRTSALAAWSAIKLLQKLLEV
jgi:aspartate dehydrogenase